MRKLVLLVVISVIMGCGSNPVGDGSDFVSELQRCVVEGTTHEIGSPGERHVIVFEGNRYSFSQFFIGNYVTAVLTDTITGYKPYDNYTINFVLGKMAFTPPASGMPYRLVLFE